MMRKTRERKKSSVDFLAFDNLIAFTEQSLWVSIQEKFYLFTKAYSMSCIQYNQRNKTNKISNLIALAMSTGDVNASLKRSEKVNKEYREGSKFINLLQ